MSVHIFVSEPFRRFSVRDELVRVLAFDFGKFLFADFTGGEKIVVPVRISVPCKILCSAVDGSIAASESHLIGDHPEEISIVFFHPCFL